MFLLSKIILPGIGGKGMIAGGTRAGLVKTVRNGAGDQQSVGRGIEAAAAGCEKRKALDPGSHGVPCCRQRCI